MSTGQLLGFIALHHRWYSLAAYTPVAWQQQGISEQVPRDCCSELRLKDIERVQKHLDGVKSLEKRGLSKEQKEELVICQKVLDWLQSGKDVR